MTRHLTFHSSPGGGVTIAIYADALAVYEGLTAALAAAGMLRAETRFASSTVLHVLGGTPEAWQQALLRWPLHRDADELRDDVLSTPRNAPRAKELADMLVFASEDRGGTSHREVADALADAIDPKASEPALLTALLRWAS